MPWRIMHVDKNVQDTDRTDSELIGVSILLTHGAGEPYDERVNVYWRARQKMQPAVQTVLKLSCGDEP